VKSLLLVSPEPLHCRLYEPRLRKYFLLELSLARGKGARRKLDAVVYDMPATHTAAELKWLEALTVPVVVLTAEDPLPVPETPRRLVLTYPVSAEDIVVALARLGVTPGADC
jgi:hypothetical protein